MWVLLLTVFLYLGISAQMGQQVQYPLVVNSLLRQISQDTEFQSKISEALQKSQLYRSFDDFIEDLSNAAIDLPIGDNTASQKLLKLFYVSNPIGNSSSNLLTTAWYVRWLQDFLKSWFSFLDSPYSALVLDARINNTDYQKDSVTPASGFLTFDQYYTREYLGSRRPVDRDFNSFISPVDGCVTEINSSYSPINISGLKVNIPDFFKKAQNSINDGRFVHLQLDNNGYHRFHMPYRGTILEILEIPGEVTANLTRNDLGKITASEGNQFKFLQSRCMLILDTDRGRVAIIGIGLIQVSSCRIYPFKKGELIQKGETLGYLSFGGNDVIVILDSQFRGAKVSEIQVGKCWKKGEKLISLVPFSETTHKAASPEKKRMS